MKLFVCVLILVMNITELAAKQLRVATFNVSMEADNYVSKGTKPIGNELFIELKSAKHPQIKNIAEIIQRVRPDIILLNEFDYSSDSSIGISAFINNYLAKPHHESTTITYPYFYTAPVNTGVDSGVDLNRDEVLSGKEGDAFGYGKYPGQYAMVILSKYPIVKDQVRTFQRFLWKDMPNNLMSTVRTKNQEQWYGEKAQAIFRLSSKSHWDVPIDINGQLVHILASHPTPPVFDGPEDRNGKRNHDEIRFWTDYIRSDNSSEYIYDDNNRKGGLVNERFIVVGDLNSSPVEGGSIKAAIQGLLAHPKMMNDILPSSEGGQHNDPNNPFSAHHTAGWKMRVDYVLPSKFGFRVISQGIFWPKENTSLYRLIQNRKNSSDHRLVYVDLEITNN